MKLISATMLSRLMWLCWGAVAASGGGVSGRDYRNRHSFSATLRLRSSTPIGRTKFGWFGGGGHRRSDDQQEEQQSLFSISSSWRENGELQQEYDSSSFGQFLAEAKRGGVVSISSSSNSIRRHDKHQPPQQQRWSSSHSFESSRTVTSTTDALRRGESTFATTSHRRKRRRRHQQQQQPLSEADFLLGRVEEKDHGEDEEWYVLLLAKNRVDQPARQVSTKEPQQQQGTKSKKINNNQKKKDNHRPLTFIETMICGAVSRSIAQTTMHPANTMKTLLQKGGMTIPQVLSRNPRLLFQGAGANFLLSIPHGAINFAMLEYIRTGLSNALHVKGPAIDFCSSCIATITCSVVSTPQMMICDNIMAGNYPNMVAAVRGLAAQRGLGGFYTGWWPGLVGKIPSYALTWTFFQQLKRLRQQYYHAEREATDVENSAMGCLASALSVCLMIPVDTIKTRLVTQTIGARGSARLYNGIIDCAVKTFQKEGIGAFYRGLPPRLISVVPMIGIQFGVYEFMKKVMLQRQIEARALAQAEDEQRRQQQKHVEDDLAVEGSDVP